MNKQGKFFLLVLIAFFFACKNSKNDPNQSSANGSAEKLFELTAGVHAWPGGGTIYLAQEKGFFTKHGLKVNIQKIENFDTKRASLIGGSIDLDIANTMDQLLIYREADFPADIIGVTDQSTGGDGLVVKDNIKSFADLKGKRIAFAEASPSDFFLKYLLKKHHLTVKDVVLNPVADPQIAGNAMISKTVDAAVTYEPFLSQADATPGINILASTKDFPTLIPGLILADERKVAANPEVYRKFILAWFEAVDYYYANTEESESIISKGMGMDLSEVKDILSTIKLQTSKDNKALIDPLTTDNLEDLLGYISAFWKESGYVKKDLSKVDMIEESLIGSGN